MPLPALARSASDPLPAVADSARAGAGLRSTMVQPGGRPLSSWLALEVSPEEESSLPRTGRLRRSLPAWTKPSGENKERVRVCVKLKSLHEGTFLHRLGYREFSNSVDTERLAPVHCKICERSKWLPQHEVSSRKRITSPLFTVSTLNPPHTGASKTTAKTFHAISFSTTPRFRCKHEKTKHLQCKFFMARRTNKGALYRNAHHRTLGDGYPPAPGSR